SAKKILHPPKCRRLSRPEVGDDARGYRGDQGATDGSPDRAAFAADQGADRVRRDVRDLLRVCQGHLQCSRLAVRMDRRTGKFQVHLRRAARIFRHTTEARDVRPGLPVISYRGWADLYVRRPRPLSQRAQGVSALSDCDADLFRAGRDGGLFPGAADARALLAAHAAAGLDDGCLDRADAKGWRISLADDGAGAGLWRRVPAPGDPDAARAHRAHYVRAT